MVQTIKKKTLKASVFTENKIYYSLKVKNLYFYFDKNYDLWNTGLPIFYNYWEL